VKLRKEQIEAFSAAARKDFENRMVVHLREFFPKKCQTLGEVGIREKVRYGIKRAGSYEITAERDVCKYIDVMFAYGWDFDKDRKIRWAGEILNDRESVDSSAKAGRLFDRAASSARKDTEKGKQNKCRSC